MKPTVKNLTFLGKHLNEKEQEKVEDLRSKSEFQVGDDPFWPIRRLANSQLETHRQVKKKNFNFNFNFNFVK